MIKEKTRYYWLDILKILACFFVIINHVGGYVLTGSGNNIGTNLFYSVNFAICKMGVPLFIMISGYLLLTRNSSFKDMLKKIYRIVIPLILLSLAYWIMYNGDSSKSLLSFFPALFSKSIILPYWYLYMLIGLYLVTPFIQKMVKNFKLVDYRAFIIICLLIPSCLPIISEYLPISFNVNFTIALLPICIGYYVAGLYLSQIDLNKKNRNIAYLCLFVPIILFILSIYLPYLINGEKSLALDSYALLTTALPSLSLFYLIRYYFENKQIKVVPAKVLTEVSMTTFGVYLFHWFIINKAYNLTEFIFDFNPYIGVIVLEILIFVICSLVTYILRKIPIVKKFL